MTPERDFYVSKLATPQLDPHDSSPQTGGDCTNDPPKILFVIDEMSSITAGGTERQLLQMVEIAINNGLAPQISVLRGTKWLTPQIAGCPVKHFDIASLLSISGLRALGDLMRWLRRERFDIMQAFFPEANFIAPWLGRLAGISAILGSRRNLNHAAADEPWNVSPRMQSLSNLLVDHVVANSEAVLERTIQAEHLPRRKISVVYNGIDANQLRPLHGMRSAMRRQLGIADDELLVGNISGLRKIKGVDCFVEAAALARHLHPKLRFVLIGDGDMREDLKRIIAQKQLQSSFLLTGAIEDVRPYLAAMDIAVLCSYAEGFSNSLLEYMLAGLPVVATDVGGNCEALSGAGILIQPGSADQLASAVTSLLDVDLRDQLAAAALKAVRRFDLKVADERIGTLLWDMLIKKSRCGLSRPTPRKDVQNFSSSQAPNSGSCRDSIPENMTSLRQVTCIASSEPKPELRGFQKL